MERGSFRSVAVYTKAGVTASTGRFEIL